MRRAVFLDRDGVLNRGVTTGDGPFAPSSIDELEIMPGVATALNDLRAAGFLLVVVTNQPDVPRGLIRRDAVEGIHTLMRQQLPIDDLRVCYHDDAEECACRKPKPGMLYAAGVDHEIQLARSFMVGDRWRDIGAGRQAGCTTILVNAFPESKRIEPDIELADLPSAVKWILSKQGPGSGP